MWTRFEMWWTAQSPLTKVIAFVAVYILVVVVTVGVGLGFKAVANTSTRGVCVAGASHDLSCYSSKTLVKKFKNNKLGRQAGFHPKAYFTNPGVFKERAHYKMVRFLRHHPKVEGVLRQKYLTKRDPGCTDNCLAWKAYSDLMSHSTCGPAIPFSINPSTCEGFETGHSKAVVRGVTVAYCGGALVLGAVGAFSTEGAAAPAAATIYGGIGCGWGFLSSFTN